MASIADILMEQGRRAGELRRQRANIWAPTVQQIAQVPAQIMADRASERAAQEQAYDRSLQRTRTIQQIEGEDRKLAQAEASAAQQAQMRDVLASPGVIGEDGRFDVAMAQRTAQDKGYRDVLPDVLTFGREWNEGVDKGLLTREQVEAAKRANQPKPVELQQVDPTKDLIDPITGEIKRKGAGPEPKLREVIVKGPNGRPIKKLVPESELMQGVEQYVAPRADAQPSFQAKEVLNDAGTPVMANFDARSGRYIDPGTGQPIQAPRPVPSAMETQDSRKFKQAEPILRSVNELSERINTQQGAIAKIGGAVERAKAQANYNDDVAEYEALVSGFTPLVARALGHTGVLTQQDVDSVKALFPRPGDSKSLRDRKISRIKTIIGELEAGAGGGTPPADPLGLR